MRPLAGITVVTLEHAIAGPFPVPALGEHTAAILADFGYSAERIDVLRADKAI